MLGAILVDMDEALRTATDALISEIADVELATHTQLLLSYARPGIRLLASQPATDFMGGSRIGGALDLPVGMAWPLDKDGRPYSCWLQLNFADLPQFSGNPLPANGMLHLFVENGGGAANVDHRLIYTPTNVPLRRVPADEMPEIGEMLEELIPHDLGFRLVMDLPHWATNDHEELCEKLGELENDEPPYDALEELGWGEDNTVGQLLGHVRSIGSDCREDAFVVREIGEKHLYNRAAQEKLDTRSGARRWHNLILIESSLKLNLTIWDAGYLNVLIEQDDLTAQKFTNTYASIETS